VVIGFSLPARDAVDERYARLTAAGYAGGQPPLMPSGAPVMLSWPIPTAMTSA